MDPASLRARADIPVLAITNFGRTGPYRDYRLSDTVLFAMGRLPGWIAHWKDMMESPKSKIGRPRQIYTGPTEHPYVPVEQRG